MSDVRLIDADYGQKQLTIAEVECGKNFETDCNHVRDFLNAMPTIDAVPVVRCRDCKRCYKHTTKRYKQPMWICMRLDMDRFAVRPDDFCSYGERKDGEQCP